MNNEKQKILDMLEKGTITPADAAKLLECLGESQREETALVRQSAQRMKGKKLRVQVQAAQRSRRTFTSMSACPWCWPATPTISSPPACPPPPPRA